MFKPSKIFTLMDLWSMFLFGWKWTFNNSSAFKRLSLTFKSVYPKQELFNKCSLERMLRHLSVNLLYLASGNHYYTLLNGFLESGVCLVFECKKLRRLTRAETS
jgi:hypothetical protein